MVHVGLTPEQVVDVVNTLHGTTMTEEEAINMVAGHNLQEGQANIFQNFKEIYRHIGRCPNCQEWRYPNEFIEGLCPGCYEDELMGE